jgi:hypothetical protein
MDIYEAPDIETAHKVSIISRAGGAVAAESWQALPYDDFLKLLAVVAYGSAARVSETAGRPTPARAVLSRHVS